MADERERFWVWQWIVAMVKEPGVWPVLLVGTCLFLGMIALVVVRALDSQNSVWIALVALLFATTLIVGIRDSFLGRVGVFSRAVVGLWGLAILIASISMSAL